MPNPRGNPESLKKYKLTTKTDKPLKTQITLRITEEMLEKLKQLDDYPEFCRQVIQDALNTLEQSEDSIEK
ncbi:hypothetical protein PI95_016325 [Hassallia byssoidea VB512170]|uniref:Uncharacterized protein n=1 Tax=Hassallia byssoidea VB512170 TaxID=1304833 RepID=A0A846HBX2_9CYAN|nr:hypothetical protein [Hassalia byssoidea]NEU74080.1 hypothetical protein [Hassalia byssoidea VB512170]